MNHTGFTQAHRLSAAMVLLLALALVLSGCGGSGHHEAASTPDGGSGGGRFGTPGVATAVIEVNWPARDDGIHTAAIPGSTDVLVVYAMDLEGEVTGWASLARPASQVSLQFQPDTEVDFYCEAVNLPGTVLLNPDGQLVAGASVVAWGEGVDPATGEYGTFACGEGQEIRAAIVLSTDQCPYGPSQPPDLKDLDPPQEMRRPPVVDDFSPQSWIKPDGLGQWTITGRCFPDDAEVWLVQKSAGGGYTGEHPVDVIGCDLTDRVDTIRCSLPTADAGADPTQGAWCVKVAAGVKAGISRKTFAVYNQGDPVVLGCTPGVIERPHIWVNRETQSTSGVYFDPTVTVRGNNFAPNCFVEVLNTGAYSATDVTVLLSLEVVARADPPGDVWGELDWSPDRVTFALEPNADTLGSLLLGEHECWVKVTNPCVGIPSQVSELTDASRALTLRHPDPAVFGTQPPLDDPSTGTLDDDGYLALTVNGCSGFGVPLIAPDPDGWYWGYHPGRGAWEEFTFRLVRDGEPDIVGVHTVVDRESEVGCVYRLVDHTTFDCRGARPGEWDLVLEHPDGARTVVSEQVTEYPGCGSHLGTGKINIQAATQASEITGCSPTNLRVPYDYELTVSGVGFRGGPDPQDPSAGDHALPRVYLELNEVQLDPDDPDAIGHDREHPTLEPRDVTLWHSGRITGHVSLLGVTPGSWAEDNWSRWDLVVEMLDRDGDKVLLRRPDAVTIETRYDPPGVTAVTPNNPTNNPAVGPQQVTITGRDFLEFLTAEGGGEVRSPPKVLLTRDFTWEDDVLRVDTQNVPTVHPVESGGPHDPGEPLRRTEVAGGSWELITQGVQERIGDAITCWFDFGGVVEGPWHLVVWNPDGQGAVLEDALEVEKHTSPPPPQPTVSRAIPAAGLWGDADVEVTLDGFGLHDGLTPSLVPVTGDPIVGDVVRMENWGTRMVCRFDLDLTGHQAYGGSTPCDILLEGELDGTRVSGGLEDGFTILPPDTRPPTIASWHVAGYHGQDPRDPNRQLQVLTDLDETLYPAFGRYVESRDCGISELRVRFSMALDPRPQNTNPDVFRTVHGDGSELIAIEGLPAGQTPQNYVTSTHLAEQGYVLCVELSPPLPNAGNYVLRIHPDIQDILGLTPEPGADLDITLAALKGDTTGDGTVTQGDIDAIKAHLNEPVSGTNARHDVNMSGTINTLDMLYVKDRMETSVAQTRVGLGGRVWAAVSGWWCRAVDGVKQRLHLRNAEEVG